MQARRTRERILYKRGCTGWGPCTLYRQLQGVKGIGAVSGNIIWFTTAELQGLTSALAHGCRSWI